MEPIRITSRANETVKRAAALKDKKERDARGLFPADGSTLLSEALSAGIRPEEVFVSEEAARRFPEWEDLRRDPACRLFLLSPEVFEKLTAEKGSEGILSVFSAASLPAAPDPAGASLILALEGVQDPGNVGTALRCAAAFGCDCALFVGCADPRSPKTVRASMGAVFRVPILEFSSTGEAFDLLERAGVRSVAMALTGNAVRLDASVFPERAAIWIGNEGRGLSEEALRRADLAAVIPMKNAESLNAGVCAGVALWECTRGKNRHE